MGESFASWLLAIGERESRKSHFDEKGRKQLDKALETLKYSVKPSDLALERDKGAWLHEMTKQVHKMRFIATGGVLKGILKPEDEITTEEMISSSGGSTGRWRIESGISVQAWISKICLCAKI